MRTCGRCYDKHPVTFFNKDRRRPDGLYPYCKNCSRKACRKSYVKHHDSHVEMKRRWKRENPEKHAAINKAWQKANPDKVAEYSGKWWRGNREKAYANSRAYQAALRTATPPWVDKQVIRMLRKEATEAGMVIDHVDPLRHDLVCGLNVPANLQVLTNSENSSKRNSIDLQNYKLVGEGGSRLCVTH